MVSLSSVPEWTNLDEGELPHGLWEMLHLFHSNRDEDHHRLESEISTDVCNILENSEKKPNTSGWDKKTTIPLDHTLWFALRYDLGFRPPSQHTHTEHFDVPAIKQQVLSTQVDYHALGNTLTKILSNKRIMDQVGLIIAVIMRPFFEKFSTTEGGNKFIYHLIHDELLTGADKELLIALIPNFAKTNWGGFILKDMALNTMLSPADKEKLANILPDLITTPSGPAAMIAMENMEIFQAGETREILRTMSR